MLLGHTTRAIVAAAALVAQLTLAAAPASADPQWPDSDTVQALIVDRAVAHNVRASTLLCVAFKESRYNVRAINPFSAATGIAQWLPGRGNAWDWTSAAQQGINIFAEYAKGNVDAVYYDVDMMAEMFQRGLGLQHWPETARGC